MSNQGTDQLRLEALLGAVSGATRLLILAHNDPDPDAIAAAVGLKYLLDTLTPAVSDIAYGGIVGRAENRALVRYLGVELRQVHEVSFASYDRIALIDTQPGAGNNALPVGRQVDVVVDHHQPLREGSAAARYVDVRQEVGSTSTIVTGYLAASGLEIYPRLATGLFYGIQTDTMGLGRRIGSADEVAYMLLHPLIEVEELVAIERAQVPREYFKAFADALDAARVYDRTVVAHLGDMYRPDMAAEMADVLLRLEGTRWVLCTGFHRDTMFLSVRSTQLKPSAGEVIQTVVRELGMAGGHGTVGGGQILVGNDDHERLVTEVTERFFAALGLGSPHAEKLV